MEEVGGSAERQAKARKSKRARHRALIIFYISAFSAVVIGAVLLCIFVFFRVGSVSVSGGEYYLQEDILSVLNIHEGDNLVLLATEDREAELERRFPYMESVEIKKKIPSTVVVEITKATTRYSVESSLGYLYVSHDGKVLEIAEEPCPGSAVVLGGTPTCTEPSQQIAFEEDSAELVFSQICEQLPEEEVENITDIDMRNQYEITMTYDDRIVFKFGNTNGLKSKMEFGMEMLHRLIEDGDITEETTGEIDLTVVPDKNKAFYQETVGEDEQMDDSAAQRDAESGLSDENNTTGDEENNSTEDDEEGNAEA